ncbi:sigma-54-dependent transcriptional regulator [Imbroritus primus]|uniref:sigma-54-dependent transcriptional regulator n=1 Tax=Imbroritus primus TaxID=3058603 RepID=UPI003D160E9D
MSHAMSESARLPILVVDDEADLRELLDITIRRMGHDVVTAPSLAAARAALARTPFSLVLTDMRLGDGLGIELVRELAAAPQRIPVAVVTAYGSADNAVEALKAGAFDYIAKPVALEQLRTLVMNALDRNGRAPVPQECGLVTDLLPGRSAAIGAVHHALPLLARSMAPVVIGGESGSGKERAARAVHALSARAAKPFVAVNCGAIPETLMEAEFFGVTKGAFTGADTDRGGFFQSAHGGTLLLDEVADLPLPMQVKLLRVLQERRVRRIGASREEAVDVRIMCASHQDLAGLVAAGRFRKDLFYRLNVLQLRMPTLRERREDLPQLTTAILAQLAARYGDAQPRRLSPAALAALADYAFPGNVRELENLLERAYTYAQHEVIEVGDLGTLEAPQESQPPAPVAPEVPAPASLPAGAAAAFAASSSPDAVTLSGPAAAMPAAGDSSAPAVTLPVDLPQLLETTERQIILQALRQTGFNRTAAAPLLGLSFRQLRYRMTQLGIRDDKEAGDGG